MPLRHVVQQADHRNRRIRQPIRPSIRTYAGHTHAFGEKETPQGGHQREKHKSTHARETAKRYLADLEMLDFKDYSKMVEVEEGDEHIRVFFKKDKEVIHQIVVVIRSTEDPEEDGILVLLKGEFNIKDIHKIIKHDAFK